MIIFLLVIIVAILLFGSTRVAGVLGAAAKIALLPVAAFALWIVGWEGVLWIVGCATAIGLAMYLAAIQKNRAEEDRRIESRAAFHARAQAKLADEIAAIDRQEEEMLARGRALHEASFKSRPWEDPSPAKRRR